MKRRFCTILIVALLVLPAASLGVAQEATPPPEDWGGLHDLSLPAPSLQGEAAVPWFPPERSGPCAVITVTTTDDELNSDGDCSLREAIEAANLDAAVDACVAGSGDDTVLVPAGTYVLALAGANEDANQTGDLDILDNLTLTGDGAEVTILDGNSLDRVVQIHTGRTVEISALTVTGGLVINWNGSAISNHGTLTLNDATVRGNTVQSAISHGFALANEALVQDATAHVNHSLIAENTAPCCAGVGSSAGTGLTAELHLDHTSVLSNTASMFAGGVYSGYYSGATNTQSYLTLTDSVVAGNTTVATGDGTGLSGGILATRSETTIVDSTIHDNEAFCDGFSFCGSAAGLALVASTATVERTTIRNNIATGIGNGSDIGQGSGLLLWNGVATVRNSTVSGNQASHDSGGIHVRGNAVYTALSLENSTVADNSAGLAGGGVGNYNLGAGTALIFKNSLVAGNSAPANEGCYNPDLGFGPGILDSLGNNLEDHDTCEFDQPTDLPNTDPILGPLQDNGGPTWTHALLEGSPAIDAGDDDACPPTDQRGVPRPQGPHCDISAFEAFDTVPPAVLAVRPPDGAVDVAIDAALVITFSEAISVPTFIYGVTPDPGGWMESWGSNDMVVSLTHDALAYGTVYSASVTAAEDWGGNPLAAPYTWSFSTVAAPCEPVEEVAVEGPASLLVGETGVYSATYAPLTATLPVTLTWDNGTVGSTASYTWTLPGSYTLTVTATNPCGEAVGKFPVEVSAEVMHRIYLPVVFRDSG